MEEMKKYEFTGDERIAQCASDKPVEYWVKEIGSAAHALSEMARVYSVIKGREKAIMLSLILATRIEILRDILTQQTTGDDQIERWKDGLLDIITKGEKTDADIY